MTGWTWKFLLIVAAALIVGCTGNSVRHGLYEGIKVQRDLQTPPSERAGNREAPDYQSYERMRKERLSQ